MNGDERRMLGYAVLGRLSLERGQPAAAHRFLVLAGIAACRAGCPEIAASCRQFVVDGNARHVVSRYETLADALRDEDFAPFHRSLDRELPWERSEHALAELGIDVEALAAADVVVATRGVLDTIANG